MILQDEVQHGILPPDAIYLLNNAYLWQWMSYGAFSHGVNIGGISALLYNVIGRANIDIATYTRDIIYLSLHIIADREWCSCTDFRYIFNQFGINSIYVYDYTSTSNMVFATISDTMYMWYYWIGIAQWCQYGYRIYNPPGFGINHLAGDDRFLSLGWYLATSLYLHS